MHQTDSPYRAYGYRWVVLAVYFLLTFVIALQWLTFASVERAAREAYGVSPLAVDMLSIVFMAVFLVMCIPASWMIDRYGIRVGVGFGAILTGVFGIFKGLFAHSYAMMLVAQLGLGVAQPFILNAVTAIAAKWFPVNERAGAVGVGTLSQFLGFVAVNLATPHLVHAVNGTYDLRPMLMLYGVISVVVSAAFLVFMREAPPTPPSEHAGHERLMSLDGVKHLIHLKDMVWLLGLFFIGLGAFNAIATCIDQIAEAKELSSAQAGAIMGAMFGAGILGALVVPPISDKIQRRKPFLVAGVTLVAPGILGMTLARGYGGMLTWSAFVGFFLLGVAGPIGFQYGAEIGYPAPEALSQGLILLAGQISGILFVVGMNIVGMGVGMAALVVLSLVNIPIVLRLHESQVAEVE